MVFSAAAVPFHYTFPSASKKPAADNIEYITEKTPDYSGV